MHSNYTETDEYDKELMDCPECGGTLHAADVFESDGNGNGWIPIECEDCDWKGREEWSIDRTVRLE